MEVTTITKQNTLPCMWQKRAISIIQFSAANETLSYQNGIISMSCASKKSNTSSIIATKRTGLKKLERLGGKILVQPVEIPGSASHYAIFSDMSCNRIGLLQRRISDV